MELKFGNQMLFFGRDNVKTVRTNNSAVEALDQRCDPAPLVRLAGHQERWTGQGENLYSLILVNSMEALLAAGQEESVISVVRQMFSLTSPQARTDLFLCVWEMYLSRALTQLKRWEEAVETQNTAMEHYGRCDAKAQRQLSWYLSLNGYTLQLHTGALEGLEGRCQALLDTAFDPRTQVEAHFLLGKFYLQTGRGEEAEAHLTYVIDHGNALLCRREAQVLLARLRGEPLTTEQLCFVAERSLDGGRLSQAAEEFQKARDGANGELPLTHWFNWAAALLRLGRFQEGLDLLEDMEISKSTPSWQEDQLILLCDRIVAYTGLGRLAEATQAQNQAVALFEQAKLEAYRTYLGLSAAVLRLRLGQLEGLEETLTALLEQAVIGRDILTAHMHLADYLLAVGRGEDARPHLEYVIAHAGEHRYGQEAQKALELL